MPNVRSWFAAASFATAVVSLPSAAAAPSDAQAVENLAAFARVYGYVRFFHPSDQAAAVDWDKVGIFGAGVVRDAPDREALRAGLSRVFRPIAPTHQLTTEKTIQPTSADSGGRVVFWQYLGLNLTEQPGPYRQQRVISGEDGGAHAPLFHPASPPAPLTQTIAPGLILALPLALKVDGVDKTEPGDDDAFRALGDELARIDLKALKPDDWRVRVAAIIVVWNIFQHFHPYLDVVGVKWEEALRPALARTLRDSTGEDYWATLMEMIARTHDGHGYVFGQPGKGGVPFRVAVAEGQLVVSGVGEGAPFRKGDIIVRLDGQPALAALGTRERHTPGSPHLSEFRALNQFGDGAFDSVARFEVRRGGEKQNLEYTRTKDRRGYFFNPIGEFQFPPYAEIRPGIFYVNINSLEPETLEDKLDELAAARGVIFDWRYDGHAPTNPQAKPISPHQAIIPHLIDETVHASPMRVPQISQPDRAGWTYRESTWPVPPKAPRFKGHVVFINEPSVVSYGETCMAMIANYRLATLVGAPTAGTNGNVAFIPLPGGGRVMWSAMDVQKHDHTPFYNVGFIPDFPVARTLRGIQEGRDEYLEKAIAVIERGAVKQVK